MTLNQVAYMILAVIAWPALFWIAKRVQKTSGVTIQTVGFSICFAITTTLQIEAVYNGLTNITGINNIGWLLGYALGCLGIFLSVDGFYKAQNLQTPSYLRTVLFLCLSIILVTSPTIAAEPNHLHHEQPMNIAQWFLMGGIYAYGLLVTITIALNFNRLRRTETLFLTRFRWSILIFSSTNAAIFFTGRFIESRFLYGSLKNTSSKRANICVKKTTYAQNNQKRFLLFVSNRSSKNAPISIHIHIKDTIAIS